MSDGRTKIKFNLSASPNGSVTPRLFDTVFGKRARVRGNDEPIDKIVILEVETAEDGRSAEVTAETITSGILVSLVRDGIPMSAQLADDGIIDFTIQPAAPA